MVGRGVPLASYRHLLSEVWCSVPRQVGLEVCSMTRALTGLSIALGTCKVRSKSSPNQGIELKFKIRSTGLNELEHYLGIRKDLFCF